MNPGKASRTSDAYEEVSALIETLHETNQRLEALTGGEVDTVADRDGRTFLLRHAQDRLRHSEATKQTAILNALPAHIALLDLQGKIISVNEAWRRFADANAVHRPGHAIGLNYLDICDSARGDHSSEAHQVAEGIRSVLSGGAKTFSIEYPCHSPTEQRWFLMTVTPLADDRPNGAVVMHLNITERKRTENALEELSQQTERRERMLSTTLSSINDFAYTYDREGRFLFANQPLLDLWGITLEAAVGKNFLELGYPEELAEQLQRQVQQVFETKQSVTDETPYTNPAGLKGYFEYIFSPALAIDGTVEFVVGSTRDVTERRRSAEALRTSEQEQRQLAQQLEIERSRLVAAQRVAKVGSWETDLASMSIIWSDETHRIHETNPATFHPTHPGFLRLVHPDDRAAVQKAFGESIGQHAACAIEHRLLLPDGRIKFVEERWQVLFDTQERPVRAIGTCQDISERRNQEQKIARLSRIHAVLSGINAAIVRIRDRGELFQETCRIIVEHGHFTLGWIAVLDHATGKLTAVAQAGLPANAGAGSELFDGSVALLPGGTAEVALREKRSAVDNAIENAPGLVPADEPDTLKVRRAAIALGAKSVIVLPLVVERETFGILTLYAPEQDFFDDEEVKLLNELAGDISFGLEFIAKGEKVDYLAYYDALTGLANRSLFLERVAQYMRSAVSGGHKLALFLIDLERFKNINDSLGQPAGDALLRQVGEWLTRNVGDANLLARIGADHFAVVLPEIKQEGDLARLLEKTVEAFLEHSFRLNDAIFRIAVKVGVALFPDDGTEADTLFKNAEAALKKAKTSGDRLLFYTQKMTETVASKLTLENQLRQALDKEEFVLHYQPKVNLDSGRVAGAEALIRWNDPRTGMVPPGRFIPILEETGLIHEVGRWALRKAIEEYLRWRTAGLAAVRIAVNVSPLQLRSRGFIAEIQRAIGIDAHAAAGLELEITESLIMEDVMHNIASLREIRAMGVTIAIDDFGTGFSSLSYLSKLPVDTLKIDRSFVTDMTAGPEGLALVSTIITLAHSLKLKVVAEGVETEEQLRLLRVQSCDEMQGFLFSKPVPSEIFEAAFLPALPTG